MLQYETVDAAGSASPRRKPAVPRLPSACYKPSPAKQLTQIFKELRQLMNAEWSNIRSMNLGTCWHTETLRQAEAADAWHVQLSVAAELDSPQVLDGTHKHALYHHVVVAYSWSSACRLRDLPAAT
jgi:hypothetical protein